MRNNLNCGTEIFTSALFIKNVPVDLARCKVGIPVKIFIDKALIMAEIKIGFGAVLGYIYLTVLIRTHGPRVDIDIRIQLLRSHLQPARFEKSAQRGSGNTLT